MIFYKKENLLLNGILVDIKIDIDSDDIISINSFSIDFTSINVDFDKISDSIFNLIDDIYKKYDIIISIEKNKTIGYTKLYKKDDIKLGVINDVNNNTKAISIMNNGTFDIYNINSVPEDIIKIIIQKNNIQNSEPSVPPTPPAAPVPVPAPAPAPPPPVPPKPEDNTALDKVIDSITPLDIPNDVDPNAQIQTCIDNQTNLNDINPSSTLTSQPPNISNNTDSDMNTPKKLDMSSSLAFNNLFDETLNLMDKIGPSPELFRDLSNPDPTVSNKIKKFLGE